MRLGRTFVISVIVMFCAAGLGAQAGAEGRSKEVAPGVYMISDLSFSISGFIVTDEGVVVVDTQLIPFFAEEIIKEIKAVTDKPIKYVINTHWHTDHTGGNEAFVPQARIIGHEFTREIIAQRKKEQQDGKVDESLKQLGEFKFTPPDISFRDSMTLHMGNRVIELKYFGGGHSGGDIVVYLPREKVLFSGDLFIKGSGMPDYRDDSNIDKMIASLKKMQALDIEKIVCGHIGTAEKKDIRDSIDKLIAFRKKVQKYVDDNIPLEKAAESIKFPEGENPFYQQKFKKVIAKVYADIKSSKK